MSLFLSYEHHVFWKCGFDSNKMIQYNTLSIYFVYTKNSLSNRLGVQFCFRDRATERCAAFYRMPRAGGNEFDIRLVRIPLCKGITPVIRSLNILVATKMLPKHDSKKNLESR